MAVRFFPLTIFLITLFFSYIYFFLNVGNFSLNFSGCGFYHVKTTRSAHGCVGRMLKAIGGRGLWEVLLLRKHAQNPSRRKLLPLPGPTVVNFHHGCSSIDFGSSPVSSSCNGFQLFHVIVPPSLPCGY